MMPPFREGEFDPARDTAVHALVLHPVIGHHASRLVGDGPAENAAFSVTYIHDPVIPAISHEHNTLVAEVETSAYVT